MGQPAARIDALFRRVAVMDLPALQSKMQGRSVRSLYRDLDEVGYLTSYSHAGRYYTLHDIPHFDRDGLWQHGGVLFSRDGTLKKTVARLVEQADAGLLHRELALRVGLRVHNTLADLVAARRLAREPVEGEYLYVSSDAARAGSQVTRRAQIGAPPPATMARTPLDPAVVIEVLVEVIHGNVVTLDVKAVAARLGARGVRVSVAEVEEVLRRHGVEKKAVRSRSARSRR